MRLEDEFAQYADEAAEWAALGMAILSEGDVAMLDYVAHADANWMTYVAEDDE